MSVTLKISVIIDTYNYGHFLETAIKSVINQTLDKSLYEIIVVDDGSTDDTRRRAEKYLPEITYHYKENGGQASAFNEGIKLSKGELIAFLDSDDYWHPEKLAQILGKFRSDPDIGVVYHKLALINSHNEYVDTFPKWFSRIAADNPSQNYGEWQTIIGSSTSGIAIRATILKKMLPIPDEFKLCADGYLMVCAPAVTCKFGLINSELGYYRIHGANGYTDLTKDGKSQTVKSETICAHYDALFIKYLENNIKKFGIESCGFLDTVRAQSVRDKVFTTLKSHGKIKAISHFWAERAVFSMLPVKYRLFRYIGIFLRLFIDERTYFQLKKIYSDSFLWGFINSKSSLSHRE